MLCLVYKFFKSYILLCRIYTIHLIALLKYDIDHRSLLNKFKKRSMHVESAVSAFFGFGCVYFLSPARKNVKKYFLQHIVIAATAPVIVNEFAANKLFNNMGAIKRCGLFALL